MSDGSIAISNGKEVNSDLKCYIIDRTTYDDLVSRMEEEAGDAAYSSQAGEIWFHDVLFREEKELGMSL